MRNLIIRKASDIFFKLQKEDKRLIDTSAFQTFDIVTHLQSLNNDDLLNEYDKLKEIEANEILMHIYKPVII